MELVFQRETELIGILIKGAPYRIEFTKLQGHKGYMWSGIEGLKLDPHGILKQFPDLKGMKIGDMRKEAIKRLKEHIFKMDSMEEVKKYVVNDLKPHGYKLIAIRRKGFRPVRVKDGSV